MPSPACVEASELFASLSPAQRGQVTVPAAPRTIPAGARLFAIGEEAREIYVVCRGEVELTFPLLVMGKTREIRFQVLGAGSTLAWSALVPPHRLTMSARALTETEVCGFPRQSLVALFEREPGIGYSVTARLAQVVAARLLEFQALWVKEMQRNVAQTYR